MERSRNLLIIAYYFPPHPAVGGHRPYGFAKYLARSGWSPTVLTAKSRICAPPKPPRGASDPFDTVRTTHSPAVVDRVAKSIRRRSIEWVEYNYAPGAGSRQRSGGLKARAVSAVKRAVNAFLYLPDEARNWILPAVLRALSIISEKRVSTVITTSPPFSANVIGLILKKLAPIAWVADLRDPWITPFNKAGYPTTRCSIALEKALEKKAIRAADLVLTTNDHFAGKLAAAFPDKSAAILSLPNGWDPEQFGGGEPPARASRFTICYTGSLYQGRSPEPLFQAVGELKEEGRLGDGEVALTFIGNCRFVNGVEIGALARRYGLEKEVEVRPPVTQAEALRATRQSDLSLVLAPNQPYQVPAKIYDAIGARTKVIAIAEEGATRAMIDADRIGRSFEAAQIEEIKAFLLDEIRRPASGGVDWGRVQKRYDRRDLLDGLSRRLETLL
jgi:glycosyltransferase involved in cell wall biosynthesis